MMPHVLIIRVSGPASKPAYSGYPSAPCAIGTSMAQQHLRNIMACLKVSTLGQHEALIQATAGLFDGSGKISTDSKVFMRTWMRCRLIWIKAFAV
jgi:chromate reductase, NAD(P)H dehydrogenase (quinone)